MKISYHKCPEKHPLACWQSLVILNVNNLHLQRHRGVQLKYFKQMFVVTFFVIQRFGCENSPLKYQTSEGQLEQVNLTISRSLVILREDQRALRHKERNTEI